MSRTRTKHAGARGFEKLKDDWKWPKDHGDYLFPSSWSPICPRNKDVISHAIVKSRKTFQTTPDQGLVHPETIRSHSGRHRMVNDMKNAGVSMEVGMAFSLIKDKKTYLNYGRLVEDQVGAALENNPVLRKTLKSLYGK